MAVETQTPAVQEAAFRVVHSAQVVGEAFATQYYAILQQSPELVYRFYQDVSLFGRVDGEVMFSTTTMDAINEKIQSCGSMKADIQSVDAQESYHGGVIVLVNGCMVDADDSRRKFSQTFFLAPQDKGFYVKNDIFRYVKDEDPDTRNEEQDDDIPPAMSIQEAPSVEENLLSEQSSGEVYHSDGKLPVEEVKEEIRVEERIEVKEQVKEKETVVEAVDEAPQESWPVIESGAKVEGTPKKSYASIVMKDAPATTPPTHPKSASKMQDHQLPASPVPLKVAVLPSSRAEIVEDANNKAPEGEGHSIYIRNLPLHMPMSLVDLAFQKFGPIKSDGIQLRHNNGFCYGFVEFETATAAQSAIEASFIYIDGRRIAIEEKRSTATRGNSYGGNARGRYPPARADNSSFRSEGGRRHGGYGGGRGYGRGEGNTNESEGRGDGRGYQNRSEGYQGSDQAGDGYGRMNRSGRLGSMSTGPKRVSSQA